MSDAGDDILVDAEAPAAVEVAAEAPKEGKLSVEDALQVRFETYTDTIQVYR
jgi:hypothetical protein